MWLGCTDPCETMMKVKRTIPEALNLHRTHPVPEHLGTDAISRIIDRAVNIADFHAGPALRNGAGGDSSIRSTPGRTAASRPAGRSGHAEETAVCRDGIAPMCRYPQWPRYMGGSPKEAASFPA